MKPTISISFLDHVLFPKVPEYHLRFRLLETSHYFPFTEDIEFHLLELPKFKKSADELTTGLDIWLYFLRHAEMMEVETLPAPLRQPLVLRALEELRMLSQTDIERERYESRRKAQLDYNTAMKSARMDGEEIGLLKGEKIGIEKGEKIGTIQLCERLLNRPQTAMEQLVGQSLEELKRLAEELQACLVNISEDTRQ